MVAQGPEWKGHAGPSQRGTRDLVEGAHGSEIQEHTGPIDSATGPSGRGTRVRVEAANGTEWKGLGSEWKEHTGPR